MPSVIKPHAEENIVIGPGPQNISGMNGDIHRPDISRVIGIESVHHPGILGIAIEPPVQDPVLHRNIIQAHHNRKLGFRGIH